MMNVSNKKKNSFVSKIGKVTFFIPMILFMFVYKILPFVRVILTSLKENYELLNNSYSNIGVGNYAQILSDPYFSQAIKNTFLYFIFVVPISIIISTILAWCLRRIRVASVFFQTAIFLPMVTSDIAIGIAWRVMFNDKGIINSVLNLFSINSIGWLTDKDYSLTTLIIFGIWNMIPMTTLLLFCTFLRTNDTLLLSAELDGATEWKIFIRIGIHQIRGTLGIVFAINSISAWLTFNGLFPLFNGLPGPYYNLYTAVYYIYNLSQQSKYSFGLACSASVILLVFISFFLIIRGLYDKKRVS